jgi:hypothetical protein
MSFSLYVQLRNKIAGWPEKRIRLLQPPPRQYSRGKPLMLFNILKYKHLSIDVGKRLLPSFPVIPERNAIHSYITTLKY